MISRRTVARMLATVWFVMWYDSAQSLNDAGDEQNIYIRITAWFRHLLLSLNELAAMIDKERFLFRARGLASSFEAIASEKNGLAGLLSKRPIDVQALESSAEVLQQHIMTASASLADLGVILNQTVIGNNISTDFRNILLEKKSWLGVILTKSVNISIDYEAGALAIQANMSENALREANHQLLALIAGIEQHH
jgi:hypothetical protein